MPNLSITDLTVVFHINLGYPVSFGFHPPELNFWGFMAQVLWAEFPSTNRFYGQMSFNQRVFMG